MITRAKKSKRKGAGRRAAGQAIAEFGPGLIIVLLMVFFPLVDLLAVGMAYGFLMVLNYNQVHEASLLPRSSAEDPNGIVKKNVVQKWQDGMGRFCNLAGKPSTTLTYQGTTINTDKITDQTVRVTTTASCNPFLPIPIPIGHIPGLNGPMLFSLTAERPMENPDDVAQ
jgi:hypothetical protein